MSYECAPIAAEANLNTVDTVRDELAKDIEVMLWSLKLYGIRRFVGQRFWEAESATAERYFANAALVPLESVAEHSWHVADTVLLWGPRFTPLDVSRAVLLAVIHDKLEIITGDYDPLGPLGNGTDTHAFNHERRALKAAAEEEAARQYSSMISPDTQVFATGLLNEMREGTSREARFVKAVDKLQALGFVLTRKDCGLEYDHLCFTLRYSRKAVEYFPELSQHYNLLADQLLAGAACYQNAPIAELISKMRSEGVLS